MQSNDKLSYATLQLTTHDIAKPLCMPYTVTNQHDTFLFLDHRRVSFTIDP